jgi:hypothetical protein
MNFAFRVTITKKWVLRGCRQNAKIPPNAGYGTEFSYFFIQALEGFIGEQESTCLGIICGGRI